MDFETKRDFNQSKVEPAASSPPVSDSNPWGKSQTEQPDQPEQPAPNGESTDSSAAPQVFTAKFENTSSNAGRIVSQESVSTLPPAAANWEPVQPDQVRPIPVVKVLSPVGVEYVFMTLALFTVAIALTALLLSLVNGKTDFSVLAFPTAALLVGVPVFAALFLRLKKQEESRPELVLDPSKRRSTQFTQIVSFLVSFFTVIGFVATVFAKMGGQTSSNIGKVALDCLCLLVVFGGLLAYYWRDEHKGR
jgi:protein-S-isoprenylcysteine O-methyltransferase Ste14